MCSHVMMYVFKDDDVCVQGDDVCVHWVMYVFTCDDICVQG